MSGWIWQVSPSRIDLAVKLVEHDADLRDRGLSVSMQLITMKTHSPTTIIALLLLGGLSMTAGAQRKTTNPRLNSMVVSSTTPGPRPASSIPITAAKEDHCKLQKKS